MLFSVSKGFGFGFFAFAIKFILIKIEIQIACVCVSVYDAFGKMGSNVKGGNENQPGSLQQCRSVHGPSFSGQYCKVSLKQVKEKKKKPRNAAERESSLSPTSAGSGGVLRGRLRSRLLLRGAGPSAGAARSVAAEPPPPGAASLPRSPPFAFVSAKLQIGPTSLIPPLPPILVNASTQDLVSIRCLSNSVVPGASEIACLSVNVASLLSA